MRSGRPVRITICDPLPLFRVGVTAIAGQDVTVEEPSDVLGWAAPQSEPIVLMSLTSSTQWELLAQLRQQNPDAAIIGLLDEITDATSRRAILAGVVSVVPRALTPQLLRDVCRAVIEGMAIVPIASLHELVGSSRRWTGEVELDEREFTWLRRLAGGVTVAQIAEVAGYSERMMFRLLRDLYVKLGVSSRTEALLYARERGWI